MTLNRELEDAARDAGIVLGGSVIAVAIARRLSTVRELVSAGHWVHADVIMGSYLGQSGVTLDDLDELANVAGRRLDVHLMVDDLDAAIDRVPDGLGRVTIQYPAGGSVSTQVARARHLASSVWLAVDPEHAGGVDEVLAAGADGVVVMLTPPGQPGQVADLSRLESVQRGLADRTAVGVDGGVTRHLIKRLHAAGVTYAVAGRALLAASTSRHADDQEATS